MPEPWRERLRCFRTLAGLSLRQLGQQTGVSFSTLARIERGEGEPDRHTAWLLDTWIDPDHARRCHCGRCEGGKPDPGLGQRVAALEARVTMLEKHLAHGLHALEVPDEASYKRVRDPSL
jgi:transcriptional regulator with XRE-family HTH domain